MRGFSLGDLSFLLLSAQWTLALSAVAFVGGGTLGLLIALARTAPAKPLRIAASGYILIFQGTPLVMQLFLVFFGSTMLGWRIDAWTAAALALGLNAGAFLGEIWRGSIETVPHGQWEAAKALGFGWLRTMRLVVIPQAARVSVPPTVGFLVQLVKSTSLASIIGFTELTRAGQMLNNATFRPFLVFGIVAAIYFAMCWPLSWLASRFERRLALPGRATTTGGTGP